jgi:hypothetical protein
VPVGTIISERERKNTGPEDVDQPQPFLISRFSDDRQNPKLNCICPGFELRKWRVERLAAHLLDWLPDFAIDHDDLPERIENITDYRKLIETAACRIYDVEKSATRGEIGELLLHIVCRQFSGTFPTVSKVYYKTSSNDFVKGFDLVHTRFDDQSDELELWLGEAKFWTSGSGAVVDAIASINKHLAAGFLTSEKILLGGKIARSTPGYAKLEWLFDRDTPLDRIFERLVVPILIAYDSENTASFADDATYDRALQPELKAFQQKIAEGLARSISIYCFYCPMDAKEALIREFDKKLGAFK